MRAALATLFGLSLCVTPIAGQERQPKTPPGLPIPAGELFFVQATLTEPCIEDEPYPSRPWTKSFSVRCLQMG